MENSLLNLRFNILKLLKKSMTNIRWFQKVRFSIMSLSVYEMNKCFWNVKNLIENICKIKQGFQSNQWYIVVIFRICNVSPNHTQCLKMKKNKRNQKKVVLITFCMYCHDISINSTQEHSQMSLKT